MSSTFLRLLKWEYQVCELVSRVCFGWVGIWLNFCDGEKFSVFVFLRIINLVFFLWGVGGGNYVVIHIFNSVVWFTLQKLGSNYIKFYAVYCLFLVAFMFFT